MLLAGRVVGFGRLREAPWCLCPRACPAWLFVCARDGLALVSLRAFCGGIREVAPCQG